MIHDCTKGKFLKVSYYIAQDPIFRIAQSALHFTSFCFAKVSLMHGKLDSWHLRERPTELFNDHCGHLSG